MSDPDAAGFGKFVSGFDFLQNLAKGSAASVPQMPNLGAWVAPTLNVEELDKRIEELKNVQFWLEQNSRALSATIQALEVQRMTLATLKGMNFNLGDLAQAFTPKSTQSPPKAADKPPAKAAEKATEKPADTAPQAAAKAQSASTAGMVDPLQLWGALTQQFQQIAATALKDVSAKAAAAQAKPAAATQPAARKSASGKAVKRKPSTTTRSTNTRSTAKAGK